MSADLDLAVVLEGTEEMSIEELGAYVRITKRLWDKGGTLPFHRLAIVAGCVDPDQWKTVWGGLQGRFLVGPADVTHEGITAALARAEAFRAKGAAMAEARWSGKRGGGGPGGSNGSGGGGHSKPRSTTPSTPDSMDTAQAEATPQQADGGFGGSVSSSGSSLCLSGSDHPVLEVSEKHTREADAVRAVFAHYRGHHPRSHPRPQATSLEWRKVAARLREGHSVADLCQAIDGYHQSPFHLGENDRNTAYLEIGLLLRDADHVAAGIRFAEQGPAPVLSQRTMRNMRAVANAIAEHKAPERPAWLTPITADSH